MNELTPDPKTRIMKLKDLITALKQQALRHGPDIECSIWVYDRLKEPTLAMSTEALPSVEFIPDAQYGNWLSLNFKGTQKAV